MSIEAARVAAWRKRHPDRFRLVQLQNQARARAKTRLAEQYPDEFERLFRSELRKAGVPRWLPVLQPERDGRTLHGRQR